MFSTQRNKPDNEITRFTDAVQMYMEARRDGTPDAILVALADDVIESATGYAGLLWDICKLQNELIHEKGNLR